MKLNRELRARASIERRDLTDAEKSAGYIGAIRGSIPFNSDSEVLMKRGRSKPFVEQIAPEAFKRSLKEDADIMVNAGHTDDPLAALGRIGENLTVTTDARSMTYEALVPDTKAGRDMLTLIDKKIIRGTSFEFEIRGEAGEKWEARDAKLDQRTITDARLLAFNPVIWPAYTDTSLTVEMRKSRRGYYVNQDEDLLWMDGNMTADTAFALQALSWELAELCESLDYLRDNPAGAHSDYAKAEISEAQESITALTAWLAANGSAVPPALDARSKSALADAAKLSTTPADQDRERRYRLLKLRST